MPCPEATRPAFSSSRGSSHYSFLALEMLAIRIGFSHVLPYTQTTWFSTMQTKLPTWLSSKKDQLWRKESREPYIALASHPDFSRVGIDIMRNERQGRRRAMIMKDWVEYS